MSVRTRIGRDGSIYREDTDPTPPRPDSTDTRVNVRSEQEWESQRRRDERVRVRAQRWQSVAEVPVRKIIGACVSGFATAGWCIGAIAFIIGIIVQCIQVGQPGNIVVLIVLFPIPIFFACLCGAICAAVGAVVGVVVGMIVTTFAGVVALVTERE